MDTTYKNQKQIIKNYYLKNIPNLKSIDILWGGEVNFGFSEDQPYANKFVVFVYTGQVDTPVRFGKKYGLTYIKTGLFRKEKMHREIITYRGVWGFDDLRDMMIDDILN